MALQTSPDLETFLQTAIADESVSLTHLQWDVPFAVIVFNLQTPDN